MVAETNQSSSALDLAVILEPSLADADSKGRQVGTSLGLVARGAWVEGKRDPVVEAVVADMA